MATALAKLNGEILLSQSPLSIHFHAKFVGILGIRVPVVNASPKTGRRLLRTSGWFGRPEIIIGGHAWVGH